jgi:hypothetical protein
MKPLVSLILLLLWVAGVVIAKGFWSVFFAVVFPLWAYYLVIEQFINKYFL